MQNPDTWGNFKSQNADIMHYAVFCSICDFVSLDFIAFHIRLQRDISNTWLHRQARLQFCTLLSGRARKSSSQFSGT